MWPLSPGITSHPFGILLLFLSHQALKCLMQYNCEGIRLEILFGVIVAPWTRCMTTIAWATVLGPPSSISMNNYSSPTPYEQLFLDLHPIMAQPEGFIFMLFHKVVQSLGHLNI
jgi:hypothetical protein